MTASVLFAGAYDEGPGYPRTTSLRQGLLAAGVAVRECRVAGLGMTKQRALLQPWRWPSLWWQQRSQQRWLAQQVRAAVAAERPQCVVVPYPGHLCVRTVREAVTVPVVLDLFLSAYDTVIEDRQLARPGSLAAHWLQQLDSQACAAADLVLLDTPANAAYAATLTGLPSERFAWLPVHDPLAPVAALPYPARDAGRLQLLFFGTGVPLHGLRTLLAALRQAPAVELVLVGGTRTDRELARRWLGDRVRIEPRFVDRARLQELLAQSHLVAGVFGDSGKAQRVVPFKLVHALAAGRPVLTAATPAVHGWLDGCGAVFDVPAADVPALAARLRELAQAPAVLASAAAAARPAYERHFGTAPLAARWQRLLAGLAERAAEAAA